MAVEIERKFLVKDDSWRSAAVRSYRLTDGLIARSGDAKVRIRICEDTARLAVKTRRSGITRYEYEYAIPLAEAEEMLRTCCESRVLTKTRHIVPVAGLDWEVDIYDGIFDGTVFAEVEVPSESFAITLPAWAGAEITGNPYYGKQALYERYVAPLRRPTIIA